MKEIVNKFLSAGNKFMPDNLDLRIVVMDRLQKTKKEYKYLKKQKIRDIFIKTN